MSAAPARLVLASRSEVRQQLLRDAGITFSVDVADADEEALGRAWSEPGRRARELAAAKARAVSVRQSDALVLGADQVGTQSDGTFLDKPRDTEDHVRLLLALAGRTHTFHVGAALVVAGQVRAHIEERAAVTFRAFDEGTARAYVATGEGAWCCGGYQIEQRGAQLVERVDGSLHAVLGLPLLGVLAALRELLPALTLAGR